MAASVGTKAHDDPFVRRIVHRGDRTLIESRCLRCGAVVVGSVTEHLVADERAHLLTCPHNRQSNRAL